jgi:hypothetical protein
MQLPQDLQPHVAHATLFVVSDHVTAKLFLAGGDMIEEVEGISEPHEPLQDSEGSFTSSDGSRVAGPNADIDDRPRQVHFIKRLAEHIESMVQEHGIVNIHLVMPADVLHPLKAHLPGPILEKIRTETPEMLMKKDILGILQRIFA